MCIVLCTFIFFENLFLGEVEEKRASCVDVKDVYHCFLESVYENKCDLAPEQMKLSCALMRGPYWENIARGLSAADRAKRGPYKKD